MKAQTIRRLEYLVLAIILAGLVVVFTGCTNITGPKVDYYALREMDPVPGSYVDLYAATKACLLERGLHVRRDFEDARFFVADSIVTEEGRHYGGSTLIPGDFITIIAGEVGNVYTVRHEMGHHITQLGDAIHTAGGAGAICDGWDEYLASRT